MSFTVTSFSSNTQILTSSHPQIRFHSPKPTPFLLQHPLSITKPQLSTNYLPLNRNRVWSRSINASEFVTIDYNDDDYDSDEEDEDDDRSLDLLVRFIQNMFKKVSKRARKAVRSVLPTSISTKLVGFAVNGVLVLAFLWVSKAFLEVVCTLGTVVFVSILLIRVVWAGVSYLQENRNLRINQLEDDHHIWTSARPATT